MVAAPRCGGGGGGRKRERRQNLTYIDAPVAKPRKPPSMQKRNTRAQIKDPEKVT